MCYHLHSRHVCVTPECLLIVTNAAHFSADGVIVVDTGYYVQYVDDIEDMDVIGHPFSRDLYVSTIQIYPPTEETAHPLTKLQERLLKKVGDKYRMHTIILQTSVLIRFGFPGFFLIDFFPESFPRSSSRLMIRKVQFAPDKSGPQPTAEISRHFLMSDDPLHLEASLDKETYYHGDPINVNIKVKNNSNKLAKGVKVSGMSFTLEDRVAPSASLCKTYTLLPLAANNIEKHGIALDGKLKQEETNLASSTIIQSHRDSRINQSLLNQLISVVCVCGVGMLATIVELPFMLMNPNPGRY
uniref:Arrestin C-terminal-like domain-containing protein n=1 Tax=Callorhinchus milii TaxID=7868 RepID=A0A4W3I6E6_CALMI